MKLSMKNLSQIENRVHFLENPLYRPSKSPWFEIPMNVTSLFYRRLFFVGGGGAISVFNPSQKIEFLIFVLKESDFIFEHFNRKLMLLYHFDFFLSDTEWRYSVRVPLIQMFSVDSGHSKSRNLTKTSITFYLENYGNRCSNLFDAIFFSF